MPEIPRVEYAIVGGSGTRDTRFPEDLNDPHVRVLEDQLVFDTPYGRTARFKLLEFTGGGDGHVAKRCLYARYHGWLTFAGRFEEQHRTFWVLQQAGVRRILADGSVGGVSLLLEPGDLVVPHDFIDLRTNVTKAFQEGKLLRMRQPFCPEVRGALLAGARAAGFPRVFRHAVLAVTEGPRFETPAEVQMIRTLGADIVGQSTTPETVLARAIGACYACAQLVSNHAEGLVEDWDDAGLWERYRRLTGHMARTVFEAMARLGPPGACLCAASGQSRPAGVLDFPDR